MIWVHCDSQYYLGRLCCAIHTSIPVLFNVLLDFARHLGISLCICCLEVLQRRSRGKFTRKITGNKRIACCPALPAGFNAGSLWPDESSAHRIPALRHSCVAAFRAINWLATTKEGSRTWHEAVIAAGDRPSQCSKHARRTLLTGLRWAWVANKCEAWVLSVGSTWEHGNLWCYA